MSPIISTPQSRADALAVRTFLDSADDGEMLDWLTIEAKSGVKMDARGRNIVRQALHKIKRPAESVRGLGIRLASADTVLPIIHDRFVRINSAVRAADKTQKALSLRFVDKMEQEARNKLLLVASFFGAIRAVAEQGRDVFATKALGK